MKRILCLALLLIVPTLAYAGNAGDMMEWMSTSGGVNWTSAKVMAMGVGIPPEAVKFQAKRNALACRAAKVDAQRNLLEMTKGVRIDSITLVKDAMVQSDLVRSSVSGLVQKGARIVRRDLQADGSCEVDLMIPLEGGIARSIYGRPSGQARVMTNPARQWLARLTAIVQNTSWINEAHATPIAVAPGWQDEIGKVNLRLDRIEGWLGKHASQAADIAAGGKPTGLIIDARGSNFIPSMSPRLRQLRGSVLYPSKAVLHQVGNRGQLVSLFMKDLIMAQKHPRVGERPVIFKALRTYGNTRTELVLGKKSSKKLKKMITNGFLDNAGVIVVLD